MSPALLLALTVCMSTERATQKPLADIAHLDTVHGGQFCSLQAVFRGYLL